MRLRISPSFHLPQNIHSISCVATHCSNQGKFRKQFSNPHDTHLFINLLVISPKECTRVLIQQPDMCGTSNNTVVEIAMAEDVEVLIQESATGCITVSWSESVSVTVRVQGSKVLTLERFKFKLVVLSWILMICGYRFLFLLYKLNKERMAWEKRVRKKPENLAAPLGSIKSPLNLKPRVDNLGTRLAALEVQGCSLRPTLMQISSWLKSTPALIVDHAS